MASKVPVADAEDDEELSDLLDSALDDFNKHMTIVASAAPALASAAPLAPVTATCGASTEGSSPLLARESDDHAQAAAPASASSGLEASAGATATAASGAAASASAATAQSKTKKKKKKKPAAGSAACANDGATSREAEEWMKAFNDELKQAEKEFGSAMQQFTTGDPQFANQFEEMMKGLESASSDGSLPFPGMFAAPPFGMSPSSPSAGSDTASDTAAATASATAAATASASLEEQLAQTLTGMQEDLKSSANVGPMGSEDDLLKFLQQQMTGGAMPDAGAAGGTDPFGGAGFIPMMENMMQTLLSQDVLYPSVKELSAKLQEWLVAHEKDDAVSADDRTRYGRQLDILKSVCSVYEAGEESESDTAKRERYDTVLHLMQQMVEYGQPPQEVMQQVMPEM